MLLTVCFLYALIIQGVTTEKVFAMPFYALKPQDITERSQFYTSFSQSSVERKNNIKLAGKALDGAFIDVGAEFSFNKTVGPRTEKRGYKKAKIIVNGKFTDGIGGGVCQVSTTLYNALILAGLKITEYHPHSLPVSYVAPSFDAMVNSGSADLKFVNDTNNPIIIKTSVSDSQIKITVLGEKMNEKYVRQSVITGEIPAPEEEVVTDNSLTYPDLYEGEQKVVSYSKKGYLSEGYLIKYINGKPVSAIKIRKDRYSAVQGLIVLGTAKREEIPIEPEIDTEETGFYASQCPQFNARNFGQYKYLKKLKNTLTNTFFYGNIS